MSCGSRHLRSESLMSSLAALVPMRSICHVVANDRWRMPLHQDTTMRTTHIKDCGAPSYLHSVSSMPLNNPCTRWRQNKSVEVRACGCASSANSDAHQRQPSISWSAGTPPGDRRLPYCKRERACRGVCLGSCSQCVIRYFLGRPSTMNVTTVFSSSIHGS